jgi:hypothetical protein
MNIREALLLSGIGYREAKRVTHRGSHDDGYIDIAGFFDAGRLDIEDIMADDWCIKEQTVSFTKGELLNVISEVMKEEMDGRDIGLINVMGIISHAAKKICDKLGFK